ncbi:SMI1/KNR4 family protein [Shewanella gelidii]|uniref:Cell wall assembly protein n=1 Tax=Shewanella gelidii TaxID=1642821 RepID=A0A917JIZ8_9GAMM|nr:SMI1/KNR4 family protein [Shewanella gelidii]MCL1096774.1 SMI1/KNR4 family protein [Shewanella gelidii]GGI70075.1 cell wall assembly protein [Shewanella gelidii]
MNEVIDQLQSLSESVPVPLELPSFEQLVEVEEQILIPLPVDLKEYLLHGSNVIYGTLEPVTVSDPGSHTYLAEVASYAWSIGLPREMVAICQVGDSFYCMDQEGQVHLWQDGDYQDEPWESIWQWIEHVWLQND